LENEIKIMSKIVWDGEDHLKKIYRSSIKCKKERRLKSMCGSGRKIALRPSRLKSSTKRG
jgi:hypothetical protein